MLDPVEFVKSTVRPMAEHTFPYITSIVGIIDGKEGDFVGSGFRLTLDGRPFLVTAKHVVDEANRYDLGAGFVAARGAPPHRLRATPDLANDGTDLAVYDLSSAPTGEELRFWPRSRIDTAAEPRSRDYLFVHGFPGERSRFLFGDLHSKSLPYGVMERDDDLPSDLRSHEFAMDYDPANMLLERGGNADLVAPPGLSGSPVFRIGAGAKPPEQWEPDQSMIVGVVTRWNHDKKVLLATGANALVDLLTTIMK
jgi:Trypsin-like peptidase domain